MPVRASLSFFAYFLFFLVGFPLFATKESLQNKAFKGQGQGEAYSKSYFLVFAGSSSTKLSEDLAFLENFPAASLELLEDFSPSGQGSLQVYLLSLRDSLEGSQVLRLVKTSKLKLLFLEPVRTSLLASLPEEGRTREHFAGSLYFYERRIFPWWQRQINLGQTLSLLYSQREALHLKERSYHPVVAVLDSGVDYHHAGLQANLWKNPFVGELGCGDRDFHGCNTAKKNRGS